MDDHSVPTQDNRNVPQRRRARWRYDAIAVVIAVLLGVPIGGFTAWQLRDLHFPSATEIMSPRVILLKTADGDDLASRGSLRLAPVAAKAMPSYVTNAVLSIEDRNFFHHGAIDLLSIARAFMQNMQADRIVSGGSTITQQLVKILFLGPQRTYARKIKEAAIAIWVEQILTKDEILTSYLNNVYLGAGATGFPAAAKLYFNKRVTDLTVPEAAMLAGMINAPSEDDPLINLAAARSRAATVLEAMVANGKLSEQAALVAKLHPATPNPTESVPASAGWFTDWVYAKVDRAMPALSGTIRVRTTLDLPLQEAATNIIKTVLAQYGGEKRAKQAALVAMRPDGAVVAMVGGVSYADSTFNRAVQARRQPGSAFKLFDYYAALRAGFSPDDKILDAPIDVHGWEPQNYGRRYHGKVTLAEAFANSLNDATVRLSQEVGINKVIAAARDLGLHARLDNNPSLALGTSDVSLLDLTSAYAAIRAGKAPVQAWGIAAISMSNSAKELAVGPPDEPQHSLAPYQDQMIDLLRGVVLNGTGRAAALEGFAAGKTGTTQDYRDAWFVGFDNALIVGVWVGNDDHSPMNRVVGGSLPAMIWKNFMEQASTPNSVAAAAPAMPSVASEPVKNGEEQQQRLFARSSASPFNEIPESGECDIPVCERYYESFRVSDCTYQPYFGPRRICER
jgi:penicillin-binding protein 1A